MAGWGKLVAGAVLGVAGTIYATNEEVRKHLPRSARDLPDTVRRRFDSAVSAAREASSRRRAEILRDLEEHDEVDHEARRTGPDPQYGDAMPEEPARGPLHENDTRPIHRINEE